MQDMALVQVQLLEVGRTGKCTTTPFFSRVTQDDANSLLNGPIFGHAFFRTRPFSEFVKTMQTAIMAGPDPVDDAVGRVDNPQVRTSERNIRCPIRPPILVSNF